MSDILIPVGILFGISLVCAILLTLANKYFGVKEDETTQAIRDCLPGANCGACGYSGCDGYAKALAEKTIEATNLCVPGTEDFIFSEYTVVRRDNAKQSDELVGIVERRVADK